MRRSRSILLVLAFASLLTGCGTLQRMFGKKEKIQTPPRLVGSVAYVNAAQRFVLLDVGARYSPPPGKAFKTIRDGAETAVLVVTAERRSPFVSADIASGEPRRGDDVYE